MENWHTLSPEKVFSLLKTSPKGLERKEVEKRLQKFGPNKLPEEKRLTRLSILLNQFKSPLVYILLFAAAVTFFLKEFVDLGVILAAVVLNAIVGFVQENKAEQTITALKRAVEQKAKVIREGREHEVEMEEVVPGDILLVEAGDKVTADARLFETVNLALVEAALTGESVPSEKTVKILPKGINLADRENMVYQGTTVARGRGRAVVVATGIKTQFGKIALMVKEAVEEKTPLQKQLVHFGRFLTIVLSLACFLILVVGLWEKRPFQQMFTTAVAVAVAAIPEGLLVALTVILAIGMQRILKKKALVRKLVAVETLGGTNVICLDKTGTLTLGKMQVADIWTWDQKSASVDSGAKSHLSALEIGLLCNNAVIENPEEALENWKILGDPTEQAILTAGYSAGLDKEKLEKEMPRVDEIPFDSETRLMATLHKNRSYKTYMTYTKGAPERILGLSSFVDKNGQKVRLTEEKKKKISGIHEGLTRKGLRVLGVAYKEAKSEKLEARSLEGLVFAGLIGLKDPLRPEARETVEQCRRAGIRTVIVTGDHKLTTQAIAQEVGLPAKAENILEGEELDRMSNEELRKAAQKVRVYSRVEPRHKLRIIDALQANGDVVAMTGDGVNDAPALKSADIGIALGSGTDVAKAAADLVLLDDNFKTIMAAVREGRVIFENLRKVVLFLLSNSFTEIILIVGSLFLGLPLPLLAAQILWVNLIEDGPPSMALAFEPEEPGIMDNPPRKKEEPILNTEMKVIIFVVGILTDLVLFGLFYWVLTKTSDLSLARSITFVTLGVDTLVYAFCFKSLKEPLWHEKLLSNKFLNISILIGSLLLIASVNLPFLRFVLRTAPLGSWGWMLVGLFAILEVVLVETTKGVFRRRCY